jgi:hypothetical protein
VELRVALSVAIDILPGIRVNEGELVGHCPKDRAIFEMKLVDIERPAASEQTPNTVYLGIL